MGPAPAAASQSMGKSRARAKRARERKRAANQAAKAERREAEEAEERGRDLRRQVAHSEAIAFVKLFMPRAERMGAFRSLLKSKELRKKSRKNKTTVMYEALEAMQFSCRHCLVGEEWGSWHCVCEEDRWDYGERDWSEEEENVESDETDGESSEESEWEPGWETDSEEEEDEQDEGVMSPVSCSTQTQTISPEIAALDLAGMKQSFRRALFGK